MTKIGHVGIRNIGLVVTLKEAFLFAVNPSRLCWAGFGLGAGLDKAKRSYHAVAGWFWAWGRVGQGQTLVPRCGRLVVGVGRSYNTCARLVMDLGMFFHKAKRSYDTVLGWFWGWDG